MKRKAAIVMALTLTFTSIFVDGTAALAEDTVSDPIVIDSEEEWCPEYKIAEKTTLEPKTADSSGEEAKEEQSAQMETELSIEAISVKNGPTDMDESLVDAIAVTVDSTDTEIASFNESCFPDANFLAYVKDFDENDDGKLSQAEADAVHRIEVGGKEIADLTGIQYFRNLDTLHCHKNQLKTLDVSQNRALVNLNCYENQFAVLDVSQNPSLKTLDCSENQLTTLDVSQNPNLMLFYCNDNQLAELDMSRNPNLMTVWCCRNQLTTLDVSKNSQLEDLDCSGQSRTIQLTEIESGWQLNMAELVGSGNLEKVAFTSEVPEMSADGLIVFPMDAEFPKTVGYEYDCKENAKLSVTLKLQTEPELTEQPGQTEQPEQTEQPGQTEKKPEQQTEKTPDQTEKQPEQTETAPEHTAHSFGEYTVTKEPTALEEGVQTRTCTVCGVSENAPLAKLPATIKLNVSSIKLKTKQSTHKVEVSGLARGDAVASWVSNNPQIVTVNSNGKITARAKKGKATITVTLKSGLSKDIKVKVQKKVVTCTKITLNKKSVTLKKGKSFILQPTVTPLTCIQKVKYKTSNKTVATVSGKGKIKAKKKGNATITVTVGKKKVKCKVKVK